MEAPKNYNKIVEANYLNWRFYLYPDSLTFFIHRSSPEPPKVVTPLKDVISRSKSNIYKIVDDDEEYDSTNDDGSIGVGTSAITNSSTVELWLLTKQFWDDMMKTF